MPRHYAVSLKNDGLELHELIVLRLNDNETRSLAELLGSDEDPAAFSTQVSFTFACPGATSEPVAADMGRPGRYLVVCLIPSGTTPDRDLGDAPALGPPHALLGMAAELHVRDGLRATTD